MRHGQAPDLSATRFSVAYGLRRTLPIIATIAGPHGWNRSCLPNNYDIYDIIMFITRCQEIFRDIADLPIAQAAPVVYNGSALVTHHASAVVLCQSQPEA